MTVIKINQNINLIDSFFQSETSKLLINGVDEKISSFYLFILCFFSKKSSIPLSINQHENSGDLFFNKKVKLLINPSTKEISNNLNSSTNIIFLTDYKNFKKFSKDITSLNGYQYQDDIRYFLEKTLNINNTNLLKNLFENPQYIYSETEKYLANNHYPENTIIDFVESDFIANIRKSHYKEKYNQSDILKLYTLIKKEYLYKKLNFLTY